MIVQTLYKHIKSDDNSSIFPAKITDSIVSLNLSSRCINERNFQLLINALSESTLRIESLDLSFNQFFKDQSLTELIHYMECKSIDMIDCKCKHVADSPIIKALKYRFIFIIIIV